MPPSVRGEYDEKMRHTQRLPKLETTGISDDDPSNTRLTPMAAGLLDEIQSRWESTDHGRSTVGQKFTQNLISDRSLTHLARSPKRVKPGCFDIAIGNRV